LIFFLPVAAFLEEFIFRYGALTWKAGFKRNFWFGLFHILAGVPIIVCLSVISVLGLLFSREYFHGVQIEMKYIIEENQMNQDISNRQNEVEQVHEVEQVQSDETQAQSDETQVQSDETERNEEYAVVQQDVVSDRTSINRTAFSSVIERRHPPPSLLGKIVFYGCFKGIAGGVHYKVPIYQETAFSQIDINRLKNAGIAQSAAFHLTHNFLLIIAALIAVFLGYT